MRRRWGLLIVAALVVASLFLPGIAIHVHSQIDGEIAALYPESLTSWQVITQGVKSLPVDAVPALGVADFAGWMGALGIALMLVSVALTMTGKRRLSCLGLVLQGASLAFTLTFLMNLNNLCSSRLFQMLFTAQTWVYVPMIGGVVILFYQVLLLRGTKEERLEKKATSITKSIFSDVTWRRLMAVCALCALVMMFLPVYRIQAPATLTENPDDAAAISRSTSLFTYALGNEGVLNANKQGDVFSNVLSGDIGTLEPYSGDTVNIKNPFLAPQEQSTARADVAIIAAMVLLAAAVVMSLLKKVDKWFPTSLMVLAVVLLASSLMGALGIGTADVKTTASRQALYLGIGALSPWPVLGMMLAVTGAVCGVLCIHTSNEPYFVNPVPRNKQLRLIAMALAVGAIICILLPGASFEFYKAGKTKTEAVETISGVDSISMSVPERITSPVNAKGKALYDEKEKEGVMNAAQVADTMGGIGRVFNILTLCALLMTLMGLALLLANMKQGAISLLLMAFVLRLVSWLAMMGSMPSALGTANGTLFTYISLPLLLFAAFFANNADQETLPKKYKLFLMMLPFLIAVFLFAYLPLYGWSYAFYNYELGVPLSRQQYVGFKWFAEMFTNPANRVNIVRVLKNTFGMSGLNLVTSWLPMVFAIFLNEIGNTRFKKSVQIFTTLPNFISWALVFSFAMSMFAAGTGVYTKFLVAIGRLDPALADSTVWLNSPDHIWLKMWGWSTWKGLGWGAIMYLAAISGIPVELYEAAKVDGANRWHQIRYITLPSLLPTFFVLLMLSISNILNNGMEQYLVFMNSMNKASIEVLDLYVYNITIASGGTTLYSFATAIGMLKTLVSVTLLFTANFVSKKLRGESIM